MWGNAFSCMSGMVFLHAAVDSVTRTVVETVEKSEREKKRDEVEDSIRARLKGFCLILSFGIPSLVFARYCCRNVNPYFIILHYFVMERYITRSCEQKVLETLQRYPAVTVYGPRQAGKTTMVRHVCPSFTYVNLEQHGPQTLARHDPDAFFLRYPEPVILDEIQNVPELIPTIQARSVARGKKGQYVLTGSRQIALVQSLVGRTGLVWLFPLSLDELASGGYVLDRNSQLLVGGLPAVVSETTSPYAYYQDYISLYLEKDVAREGVKDLDRFATFMQLLAGRTGGLLDYRDLGDITGVSSPTIKSWMAILARSHLIHMLTPYSGNREKVLTQTPKVYFCDTGLVCGLLGIMTPDLLGNDRLLGPLFETMIVAEAYKMAYLNRTERFLHFSRNKRGKEVDLIPSV